MPNITYYPATLPGPFGWGGTAFERRAVSTLPGNTQLRGRGRDALQDVDARWYFTASEMAAWSAWYEDTLLGGMLWFAATVPGPGGFVSRVLRYRTSTLKKEFVGNGVFKVTARMQQRGISAAPALPVYLFLDTFTGATGAPLYGHAPDVAPSGFGWEASNLVLSGAGSIDGETEGTVTSGGCVASGFSITLPASFSLQMTSSRPLTALSDSDTFSVSVADVVSNSLSLFSQDNLRWARFTANGGPVRQYPVSGADHTLRLTVHGGGTASAYVDGVLQETFACGATANPVTKMQVSVDWEPGAVGSISEVSLYT